METESPLRQLKEMDERRPGFPGEHWLVLGLGTALLMYARRRSPLVRSVVTAAGTGLIARATSGRDGISRLFN